VIEERAIVQVVETNYLIEVTETPENIVQVEPRRNKSSSSSLPWPGRKGRPGKRGI